MSQHYSDTKREQDAYSLPDVETFQGCTAQCRDCGTGGCIIDGSQIGDVECGECGKRHMRVTDTKLQWFYWFCSPGCLPDSDPVGPFATEAEALADARERMGDDDSDDDSESKA